MNKKAPHFTAQAEREIEEAFTLRREAEQLLGLIVAEWKSHPMSVRFFDVRTVERATQVSDRLAQLAKDRPFL